MIRKHKCNKCDQMATWFYMPADSPRYKFCDECVPRGCSCVLIYEWDEHGNSTLSNEHYKDEKGRDLPCCEYLEDLDGEEIIED